MHNFRKLKIYQKAIDFSVEIYELTRTFPKEGLFGLTNQTRKAVISLSVFPQALSSRWNKNFHL